jgi:hypothetical protein
MKERPLELKLLGLVGIGFLSCAILAGLAREYGIVTEKNKQCPAPYSEVASTQEYQEYAQFFLSLNEDDERPGKKVKKVSEYIEAHPNALKTFAILLYSSGLQDFDPSRLNQKFTIRIHSVDDVTIMALYPWEKKEFFENLNKLMCLDLDQEFEINKIFVSFDFHDKKVVDQKTAQAMVDRVAQQYGTSLLWTKGKVAPGEYILLQAGDTFTKNEVYGSPLFEVINLMNSSGDHDILHLQWDEGYNSHFIDDTTFSGQATAEYEAMINDILSIAEKGK